MKYLHCRDILEDGVGLECQILDCTITHRMDVAWSITVCWGMVRCMLEVRMNGGEWESMYVGGADERYGQVTDYLYPQRCPHIDQLHRVQLGDPSSGRRICLSC